MKRLLALACAGLLLAGCAFVGGITNPCHKGDPRHQTSCS